MQPGLTAKYAVPAQLALAGNLLNISSLFVEWRYFVL